MTKENPVYWRMANGKLINVDDMDDNHVRNSFKMLLRYIQEKQKIATTKPKFVLRGDMANDFNESFSSQPL